MTNQEEFTHVQPLGGSDAAHSAQGVSAITAATPALTPLMLDATSNKLVAWDGEHAGQAIGVLAVATTGPQAKITYFKSGTFRVEDVKWPAAATTDELKFNAFAGTAISVN